MVVKSKTGAHDFRGRACLSTMTMLLFIPYIPRPKLAQHACACRVRAASSTTLEPYSAGLQDRNRKSLSDYLRIRFHRTGVDAHGRPVFVKALQSYTRFFRVRSA